MKYSFVKAQLALTKAYIFVYLLLVLFSVPVGDLRIFIEKLNCALTPLNLALKKGVDELTAKHFYVLVNCADTPISRLSVEYESLDLEVFKKIVSNLLDYKYILKCFSSAYSN